MKLENGYNFIRITFKEDEMNNSAITVGTDPMFAKYPIIAYCEDTGALYTGAYDDGTVTLADYGSASGGGSGSGGGSNVVYVPIEIDYTGDDPTVTCETSLSSILSSLNAGKNVILVNTSSGTTYYYYLMDYSASDNICSWYRLEPNPGMSMINAEATEWGYTFFPLQQIQA